MGETLQFVFFFEWPVTLRPGRLKTMLSLVLRPAIKRRTFFLRLPSVYKHNVDYDFFKDSLGNSRYLFVSFYVIKKKCFLLYCNVKNLNVNVIFFFIHQYTIFLNAQCVRFGAVRVKYRGIHEKGSDDVVSSVCYTIYTLSIYPSAHNQMIRHHPNPFREFPCRRRNSIKFWQLVRFVYKTANMDSFATNSWKKLKHVLGK